MSKINAIHLQPYVTYRRIADSDSPQHCRYIAKRVPVYLIAHQQVQRQKN